MCGHPHQGKASRIGRLLLMVMTILVVSYLGAHLLAAQFRKTDRQTICQPTTERSIYGNPTAE